MHIRKKIIPSSCQSFLICQKLITDKVGIEIGGPSRLFTRKGNLPLYPIARRIDNCNYSKSTTWEGEIKSGKSFVFDRDKDAGYQYFAEAWDLSAIPKGEYDFLISSKTIEHTANPIRAITEWMRVLNDTGTMVIIFPHKDGAFDRLRPVTTLEHLIQDFADGIGEDDLTHLPEILELHDLKLDPGAGSYENFVLRSQNNLENRCLHHHVFDPELAVKLVDYMGLKIHSVEVVMQFNIVIVAQKVLTKDNLSNRKFYETAINSKTNDFFISL
jgi:SAM-dependent methyltransferase